MLISVVPCIQYLSRNPRLIGAGSLRPERQRESAFASVCIQMSTAENVIVLLRISERTSKDNAEIHVWHSVMLF